MIRSGLRSKISRSFSEMTEPGLDYVYDVGQLTL